MTDRLQSYSIMTRITEYPQSFQDDFPYAEVGATLDGGLCKTLRQIALQLPTAIEKQAK